MTHQEIISKIVKLLTLSNRTNNDNEAEAALLRAQQLMAKYHVDADQLTIADKLEEEEIIIAACSHPENKGFRTKLGVVIANNFRCVAFMEGDVVMFMGERADAIIARKAFEFAYKYIKRVGTRLQNECWKNTGSGRGVFNSYALGFIQGIEDALSIQCKALKLVIPKRVTDRFKNDIILCGTYKGGCKQSQVYSSYYTQGKKDGYNQFAQHKLNSTLV